MNSNENHTDVVATARVLLSECRIIKENLVLINGLNETWIGKENLLKSKKYFGQYGEIKSVCLSSREDCDRQTVTSCFITFKQCKDALRCIEENKVCIVDDTIVMLSLGTTKYCSYFLDKKRCFNKNCNLVHKMMDDRMVLTRKELWDEKQFQLEKEIVSEKLCNN